MSDEFFDHPDIVDQLFRIGQNSPMVDNFDPLVLGQVLRDELPILRSRVPAETYAVVIGVAAVLLHRGATDMLKTLTKTAPRDPLGRKPNPRKALLRLIKGGLSEGEDA